MACTTLLVGKDASYDGSTIMARNEDCGSDGFDPKRFIVVKPEDQPRAYTSKIAHLTIELPDNPLQYTCTPNADPSQGIWGEAGVNEANVAMSATETITTNARVLGADPLVPYVPAKADEPEVPGGIGEEDLVTIVLPYIKTAREGVERLGALLEEYGTYEMNGIGFSDSNEIWWLETVGGHHWIARRVPDDSYVTMPNQLGIDEFDFEDALGEKNDYMCSADMLEFIARNHLDVSVEDVSLFNPRDAFGSHSDEDHVYNTPRAWYMQRYLNPYDEVWDGPDADHKPTSDDIAWCRQPERKVTLEDVKYVLSSHYQGTPFDPYGKLGDESTQHMYRPIGINRQCELSILQIRPYRPQVNRAIQWVTFGDNVFNTVVPMFPNVNETPEYLNNATTVVSTDNFYWANRLIAVMCDKLFPDTQQYISEYQLKVGGLGHRMVAATDEQINRLAGVDVMQAAQRGDEYENEDIAQDVQPMEPDAIIQELRNDEAREILAAANNEMAAQLKEQTDDLLGYVLRTTSLAMNGSFSMHDF